MKNLKNSPTVPVFAALAIALLSGCATRPPRQVGPPAEPVMPPPVRTGTVDPTLPSEPVILEEDLIGIPAPMPGNTVSSATVRPAAPDLQPRRGTPYTIRSGESLSAIAARNKINWVKLAEYNYITDPNKVRVGQVILIPPKAGEPLSAPAPVRSYTPAAPQVSSTGKTYVVQSGDSLSVVARRYGTSVGELKSVNGLSSDRLLVGQVLKLPAGSAAPAQGSPTIPPPAPRATPVPSRPTPTPGPQLEPLEVEEAPQESPVDQSAEDQPAIETKAFPLIVQEGDTLKSIADSYILSEDEIRKLNNLGPNDKVEPGQKLLIPSSSVY